MATIPSNEFQPEGLEALNKKYRRAYLLFCISLTIVFLLFCVFNHWFVLKDDVDEIIEQEYYGEFDNSKGSDTVKIRLFSGEKSVTVSIFDSLKIIEGDIIVDDLRLQKEYEILGNGEFGALWPKMTVPYVLNADLTTQLKRNITAAIDHWESNTGFKFIPKSDNDKAYVIFRKNTSPTIGASRVGRLGSAQSIYLGSKTSVSVAIHEIGHTIGLWHEQSRPDRDSYVTIVKANISARNYSNFEINGDVLGPYDFQSRMHYSPMQFSKNGKPTIVPIDPKNVISNNGLLSTGDIQSVKILYQNPALP